MNIDAFTLDTHSSGDIFEYDPMDNKSKDSFLFHLMYHEGPLCSVFSYSDTHVKIFDWLESAPEKSGHRWAKFIVEKESVSKYIYGAVTFREMITSSKATSTYLDVILGKNASEISSEINSIEELFADPTYGDYKYDPDYTIDDDNVKAWMLANSQSFDVKPEYEKTIGISDRVITLFTCEDHYQYALIARNDSWLEAA